MASSYERDIVAQSQKLDRATQLLCVDVNVALCCADAAMSG